MSNLSDIILTLTVLISWLAGVVIASTKGTLIWAIFIPPYAWYLVVEKIMIINNII